MKPWNRIRRMRVVVGFALLALTVLASRSALAAVKFTPVALTGQQAPGLAEGVLFTTLDAVCINNAGQVVFRASLAGPGVDFSNDLGIWIGRPGELRLVARQGQPVFDGPNSPTLSLDRTPSIDDLGGVGFHSSFREPSGAREIVGHGNWYWHNGVQTPLAITGQPAAGVEGTYTQVSVLRLGRNGHASFWGLADGPKLPSGGMTGYWVGKSDHVALAVRNDAYLPGTPAGVTFEGLGSASPLISGNGHIAFAANLAGPGVTAENQRTNWIWRDAELTLVARSGDPAPGLLGEYLYGLSSPGGLNSAGQVAFTGALNPSTGVAWIGKPGELQPMAIPGQQVPDGTAGENVASMGGVQIGAGGKGVFFAKLSGNAVHEGNDTAYFVGVPGAIRMLAREGAAAQGLPQGARFSELTNNLIALNARGHVVLDHYVTGPGISALNDNALWMSDDSGQLRLIVAEGQTIELGESGLREVLTFSFTEQSGGDDGRRSGLNDVDELALHLWLTDGSQALVIVSIPEPTWEILLLLVFVLLTDSLQRRSKGRVRG